MKTKALIAASLFALGAVTTAHAGNFQNLTTNFIDAGGDAYADPMYILITSTTYVAGYDDVTLYDEYDPATLSLGNVVPSSITYRAFDNYDPTTPTGAGTLTLLDWRVTKGVDLAPGSAQADIYDFVYRDSSDNSLVFGTRYLNRVENNEEVNFLYRYGFTGYSTSVAWTYITNSDLGQYTAVKTESTSGEGPFDYSEDVVRQQGDFSVTEGQPWSGLFLVKTDATSYVLGKAIGFFQSGEEGQDPAGGFIQGFVPTTAVPEPESYALFIAGLGVLGVVSRRRNSKIAK